MRHTHRDRLSMRQSDSMREREGGREGRRETETERAHERQREGGTERGGDMRVKERREREREKRESAWGGKRWRWREEEDAKRKRDRKKTITTYVETWTHGRHQAMHVLQSPQTPSAGISRPWTSTGLLKQASWQTSLPVFINILHLQKIKTYT